MAKLTKIGARLQLARTRRGFTLADLARRAGVAYVTVYYWEMDRSRPRAGNIGKLADILGLPAGVLTGALPMPPEEPEGFGQRLRAARRAAGLTQAALAEKTQFRANTISRWEAGVQEPSGAAVEKLAAALGVEPAALAEKAAAESAAQVDATDALAYALAAAQETVAKTLPENWARIAESGAAVAAYAVALKAGPRPEALADAGGLGANFTETEEDGENPPLPAPAPAAAPPRRMSRATLLYQRERRAAELRLRAARYALDDDDDADAPGKRRMSARAINALALADLVEAHWPRQYPNYDIAHGEGVPQRLTGLGIFSIGGSPAGQCVDGGM